MKYNYDRTEQIQKYKGRPKDTTNEKPSVWKRFLNSVVPWLAKKWELGNEFLEAKVEREKNEAEKLKAESNLLKIQAQKEAMEIADLAGYYDHFIEEENKRKEFTEKELEEQLIELSDIIKMLNLKYGFKISMSIETETDQPTEEDTRKKDTFLE